MLIVITSFDHPIRKLGKLLEELNQLPQWVVIGKVMWQGSKDESS
jgi:hypothetical protein